MIARLEPLASVLPAVVADQYVVSFGKNGGLGCFTVIDALVLARGERVVVRTARGVELGAVLGPATLRQARLIGALAAGDMVRRAGKEDEAHQRSLAGLAQALFDASRFQAEQLNLTLQILDAEILLDGQHAIVQYIGGGDDEVAKLAEALHASHSLEIRFENLAPAPTHEQPHESEETSQGGCGKPDCGRTEGGGCTTCGSGGGCSSCGVGGADLRPYFAHLRGKMEENQRTTLL